MHKLDIILCLIEACSFMLGVALVMWWKVVPLKEELEKLYKAICKSGYGVMRCSNGWSIHDVSKKAEADEERTANVISQNLDLIHANCDLRIAVQKLRSYNQDIKEGRINYRPEDHIEVCDAVLKATEPVIQESEAGCTCRPQSLPCICEAYESPTLGCPVNHKEPYG